ncbi:unnamed protein product [Paramecium octaurelia]|uniref:ER membrane protein complex subunit 1 n=1 Tax=Paramecium octaurelia TaxID=43137 RepID=A0A8S1SQS1_PAROT|nr:unnamed protein product [Paramecium octaurelia]
MFFLLLCVIIHLLSIVQAISQLSHALDNWQMRLFGQLSSIYVQEDIIYYHNTLNQQGKIFKATGQVQSRNEYIMCDFFNYVKYESNQKVVHLFNNGFQILAQLEITEKIDYCMIGLNGEFIIIAGQTIFSTIDERLFQKIENQIIYAGYIFEIPIIVIQKKNQICVFSIKNSITEDYCVQSKKAGKVIEFGKTLIYYDNYFAYHLKDKKAKEINIDLIRKTCQFLGFSETLVVRTKTNKQIVDLQGQIEYQFHSNLHVVENSETQKYYFLVKQEENYLVIQSFDRESQKLTLQTIELANISNILSAFIIDLSLKQFLVQYQDLQTVLLENDAILWQTEQSLISIDNIFYQKYEYEKQKYKNSYYESLQQNGVNNPFIVHQNAILRVLNEIKDLKEMLIQFINGFDNQNIKSNILEQSFGLKQQVCFLTTYNTLLCYDTKELKLLQKLHINNLDQTYKLVALHQIELNHVQINDYKGGSKNHILFYYSNQRMKLYTFILDLSLGSIQQVGSRRCKNIVWTIPYTMENESSQHINLIILIDEENKVFTYPENDNYLNSKEIILYKNDNGVLIGYKLQDKQLEKIWTLTIKEKILLIRSSSQIGQGDPKVANWDDGKVIFKLIDYKNFAILTSEEDSLKLQIVNAKSGKILFQGVQNEVDLDQYINLVFDEHQVFVTYQNQAKMIFEIWTVEIYHMKIECSFIKMLEYYYFSQDPTNKHYYKIKHNAVFLQQVYGFPLGIKFLGITRTRKSLTKKNLLIITTFSQLYQLDRNLVSARRRENSELENPFWSNDLPPYQYELPINFKSMVTHDQTFDFERFSLEPTNLESSGLLLVYGSDVFFTIITPDKSYDMLQNNFNYDAVILTTVIITLAIQVLQKLIKSSNQVKQFKVN